MKIAPGAKVTLHFRLFDGEGQLVEDSREGEVLEFIQGDEEIAAALERALEGKQAGDQLKVTLSPEEAFGTFDPALIVSVPRAEIPEEFELRPGEYLPVQLSEAPEDLSEEEIEFRIVEVGAEEVVLDANHPLAGETVTFEVEVLSVHPGS